MAKLTTFEADALKEICNIGVSHAANSLSEITDKQIYISVPEIELPPVKTMYNYMGGKDIHTVGVKLDITGDFNFSLLLFFSKKDALSIVDMMIGMEPGYSEEIDDMGKSALEEVGNILSSHFASSLADFLDANLMISTPILQIEKSKEIMEKMTHKLPDLAREFLVLNTNITEADSNIGGYFFLLPDKASLEFLLKKLKEKVGT